MISPIQWHRLFQTLFSLTRRTIQEQDNSERILQRGVKAETSPGTIKPQTYCIRRLREVEICWPSPLPRSAQHLAEKSPLSFWFLQWEKTSACSSTVGVPFWSFTSRLQGHLWDPGYRNFTGMEKGACSIPAHGAWKREFRLPVPSRYQSEALLIHISNLVAYTDQRIQQGADLLDVDSQIRNSAGPKGWFAHTQARSFPGGTSGKEPSCQHRRPKRHRFDPQVRKVPWRRSWQPTPVFLSREAPQLEEPGRLQSIGSQGVRHDRSSLAGRELNHTSTCCGECLLATSDQMGCQGHLEAV